MKDFVEIGVLGRPHGIRGEVRVTYYADSFELLRGEIFLQAGNQPARRISIKSLRVHHGQPVVTLEGFDDRTAAETLRGQVLLTPATALPPADSDEIYVHDLLGLNVVLDTTSALIGVLEHVDFNGSQEVWSIVSADGKELLLPAVPEFVPAINMDTEEIRIAPPEGLLELYGFTEKDA